VSEFRIFSGLAHFRNDALDQGSPNYGSRTTSGLRSQFVNLRKICWFGRFGKITYPENHITQDIRPSNYCVIAYVALGHKILETPALDHGRHPLFRRGRKIFFVSTGFIQDSPILITKLFITSQQALQSRDNNYK